MIRKISLVVLSVFYILGGVNHFLNPEFYFGLIPDYLPFPSAINIISGFAEILLGTGMLLKKSRQYASLGIIAMLIAFIPSHVYFVQVGGCIEDGLCTPLWVGWVRLLIIHPILIAWAWYHRH